MVVTHELDGDQSESLSVELSHLAQGDLVTAVDDPVLGQSVLHHQVAVLLAGRQSRPLQEVESSVNCSTTTITTTYRENLLNSRLVWSSGAFREFLEAAGLSLYYLVPAEPQLYNHNKM